MQPAKITMQGSSQVTKCWLASLLPPPPMAYCAHSHVHTHCVPIAQPAQPPRAEVGEEEWRVDMEQQVGETPPPHMTPSFLSSAGLCTYLFLALFTFNDNYLLIVPSLYHTVSSLRSGIMSH
jgi:hypothetical protein